MSRRRHWYHCTDRRGEQAWTAERRPPISRGYGEPDTPRLCVAPTLAQALAAAWWSGVRPVNVYLTEPRRTVPPSLVATIPAHAIEAAQEGLEPLAGGQMWSRFGQRFVNMVEVVQVHVPAAHERWLVEFAAGMRDLLTERERQEDEEHRQWINNWCGLEGFDGAEVAA